MIRRKTKKSVVVAGHKVELELRLCANYGCNTEFWTNETSIQSICSRTCWEYVHQKPFFRQPLPPVRRFGEKQGSKQKVGRSEHNGRVANGFTASNQALWQEMVAKKAKKRETKERAKLGPLPSSS